MYTHISRWNLNYDKAYIPRISSINDKNVVKCGLSLRVPRIPWRCLLDSLLHTWSFRVLSRSFNRPVPVNWTNANSSMGYRLVTYTDCRAVVACCAEGGRRILERFRDSFVGSLSILCEIFDASLKISLWIKRKQLFRFHNFFNVWIKKNNFIVSVELEYSDTNIYLFF